MHRHKTEAQDCETSSRSSLMVLQAKVGLSNDQLLTLTSNQCKFSQKIQKLNKAGVQAISYQRYNEGLVYLHQAQKILEYAASCGKTIDRYLITTTLQNEACAYQRIWELQKSADYMQAIIYNLNTYLNSLPFANFNQSLKDKKSIAYLNLNNYISRRLDGIFYHLQYSAVSSQINQHENAVNSVNEALNMLKAVCQESLKYEQIVKGKTSPFLEDLLNCFDFKGYKLRQLMAQTVECLEKVEKHKDKRMFNFDSKIIENFMIGEVMQIGTLTIDQAKQKNSLEEQISQIGLVYKAFYLSICYFVLGTEIRLLTQEKFPDHSHQTADFKKSKILHLYAIKVILSLIPYNSNYLRHIIKSFKKNYGIDLNSHPDLENDEISSIDIESYINSENQQFRLSDDITVRKMDNQNNETLKKKSYLEKTKGQTLCSEKQRHRSKNRDEKSTKRDTRRKQKKTKREKSQNDTYVYEDKKKFSKKKKGKNEKRFSPIKRIGVIDRHCQYMHNQKKINSNRQSQKKLTFKRKSLEKSSMHSSKMKLRRKNDLF